MAYPLHSLERLSGANSVVLNKPLGGEIMKLKNLVRIAVGAVFGLGLLTVTSADANAQGNSGWAHEKNRIRKQQKQIEKAERDYYRIYRNGSYYQTDYRGAELLRRAVNEGYAQGYRQGVRDRRYNMYTGYRSATMYRTGIFGYQSYVDRGQYQYYFRQGFERGYSDGFNSQTRYGYYSGGKWSILGNVLGAILDIRRN
jgi:hypothetical protein